MVRNTAHCYAHINQNITMFALFKKEFRQHVALAVAMVFMCLLMQVAYYEQGQWFQIQIYDGVFFSIALFLTALYAGAAAALAYSTEHADNTFIFLRKLPISHTMLAGGKIGWALCGTGLVLIANALLCAFWWLFLKDSGLLLNSYSSDEVFKACAWFCIIGTVEGYYAPLGQLNN